MSECLADFKSFVIKIEFQLLIEENYNDIQIREQSITASFHLNTRIRLRGGTLPVFVDE